MTSRTRRKVLGAAALATGTLLLTAACAQGAASGQDVKAKTLAGSSAGQVKNGALDGVTMTFTSWGGGFQEGQEKAFAEPFATDSGAKVLTDSPTDSAKIQAQVNSDNVLWDVVDIGADDVAAGCGTLFEPLNYNIIDTSRLPEITPKHKCYVPSLSYGYGIFYNADAYPDDPPDSWEDFFNPQKYPGKRAVDGRPTPLSGTLEAALLADGVAPENLYPLDVNRALRTWDRIRSNLIYWETGAQQTQMAESGEADMVFGWSGRIYEANKNGAHYVPVWNQAFSVYDVFAVVKNSPNTNAAMAFINYALGAKQQAKMSELTSYSPVNTDAKPKLSPEAAKFNTTRPEVADQLLPVDFQYWADHQDKLSEAWTAWLNQ